MRGIPSWPPPAPFVSPAYDSTWYPLGPQTWACFDPLVWTMYTHRELQPGVLWWHMRPYSYPRQIVGFLISSPICLTGRQVIPHDRIYAASSFKMAGWKDLSKDSSTGRNASQMCGWCTGRNPTPTEGTFEGQHNLSAGANVTPRPTILLSASIPPTYLLTTPSLTPGYKWILLDRSLWWPPKWQITILIPFFPGGNITTPMILKGNTFTPRGITSHYP